MDLYPPLPQHALSAGSLGEAISAESAGSGMQSASAPARKRPLTLEEEEAKAQRKREQAAERQRRKRDRDRMYGRQPGQSRPPPHRPAPSSYDDNGMGGDDDERRERVRAAARERQRKHRALVKERKDADGSVYSTPPPPSAHMFASMPSGSAPSLLPHSGDQPQTEIPFPTLPSAPAGGQTFATTLLLSFSCAPLLKQHLLNTLNMSNEELASLEPIIADAWEWWNHQRHLHHQGIMSTGGQPPPAEQPPAFPVNPTPTPQVTEQPSSPPSQPAFRLVAAPPAAPNDTPPDTTKT